LPLIGFTVMKDKILSGEKWQTIRPARKRPVKVGDPLYLYWHLRQKDCELLKTVKCRETFRLPWVMIADSITFSFPDGFENPGEMREWFYKKYGDIEPTKLFDVIRW